MQYTSDILAGMDAAIKDGVYVISLSIVGPSTNLSDEPISIGSCVCVRWEPGNDGPDSCTANNLAPWVIAVGASSINRRFPTQVVLGHNQGIYVDISLYLGQNMAAGSFGPLVYGDNAGSSTCENGKLFPNRVTGKMVLCYGTKNTSPIDQETAIRQAGGIGAIISTRHEYGDSFESSVDILRADGNTIYAYTQRVVNPVARIDFYNTVISQSPSALRVTTFSTSRAVDRTSLLGRSSRPIDMISPRVDMLAAWTNATSPYTEFIIISGTSMACPHVSGIAAMLKVARPNWSPVVVKSALMTMAMPSNLRTSAINGQPVGPLDHPNRALDPGLMYDATADDYINFLCGLGYTPNQTAQFTGTPIDCSTRRRKAVGDLNYPAFSMVFGRSGGQVTQRRRVTNVGANTNAVYKVVSFVEPPGTTLVRVAPSSLTFDAQSKTLGYEVTLSAGPPNNWPQYSWGWIEWSDGRHHVRSPVISIWE
uniref:Subtilisin-like protease n=1 Tax=Oryza punctata TaxID=4537 RepID=A0A0E0K5Y2_ORYPU